MNTEYAIDATRMRRWVTGCPPTRRAIPTTITGLITIASNANQASDPPVTHFTGCRITRLSRIFASLTSTRLP
jgi:hypothetical protein